MKALKNPLHTKLELEKSPAYRNRSKSLLSALAFTTVLGLSALSASAFTNYLANPGFESGTSGWTIVSPWTWNGASYAVQNTNGLVQNSANHVQVHGGTNALKMWGYFQTYATTPGTMQTFAAAAGSTWSSDAWVSTQIPDNIETNGAGTGSRCYLQMLFLDATTNYNAPLASYTSSGIDITTPVNTWIYQQVTDGVGGTNLLAPPNTAFVRLQIIFAQPGPSGGVYAGGSCYWDDVTLFKTASTDPEISVQPVATQTLVYGQTATFSVVAAPAGVTYQWQKDGANITDPNASGVTTPTLTLSHVTTATQGNYTCTVNHNARQLTSSPGQLIVLDPGVLTITPALGQTLTNGSTARITVSAAASSPLTYTWLFNGTPLNNGGRISGATSSNLTVANVTAADAGAYTVLINGGAAQATNGLKVVSPGQSVTNLLINAGFEDGAFSMSWEQGWTKFNGAALNTANDFYDNLNLQYPVSVWDGTYVAVVYGSDADDGFYQNVPVTAGATYHAGGMAYVSQYSKPTDPTTITLQLIFKDAGGNSIGTFTAPSIGSTFTTDTWTPLRGTNGTGGFDIVAPAGAVSATFQIYEFNWSYTGGNAYVDNLYLTPVQSVTPPSFSVKTSVSGNQINISFPTASGVTYDVLATGDLKTPIGSWPTIGTVAGDGTVKSVQDTIGGAGRFYRVKAH